MYVEVFKLEIGKDVEVFVFVVLEKILKFKIKVVEIKWKFNKVCKKFKVVK